MWRYEIEGGGRLSESRRASRGSAVYGAEGREEKMDSWLDALWMSAECLTLVTSLHKLALLVCAASWRCCCAGRCCLLHVRDGQTRTQPSSNALAAECPGTTRRRAARRCGGLKVIGLKCVTWLLLLLSCGACICKSSLRGACCQVARLESCMHAAC